MAVDLVTIIGNISQSLTSVQKLVSGLGYLLGLVFVLISLQKFHKIAGSHSGGGHESMFGAFAFLAGGVALIFLPTAITILSNTAFGTGNILEYSPYDPYNVYNAMRVLIKTAGVIWFVRGTVLLVQASEPGSQKAGGRGLSFLIIGVFAMNFEKTMQVLDYIVGGLINFTTFTN